MHYIYIPTPFVHRNHPPYIIILINVHCPLNKYSECTARLQDTSRIVEWLRKRVFRLFVCLVNGGGGWPTLPGPFLSHGSSRAVHRHYMAPTPAVQYSRKPHSNVDPSEKNSVPPAAEQRLPLQEITHINLLAK